MKKLKSDFGMSMTMLGASFLFAVFYWHRTIADDFAKSAYGAIACKSIAPQARGCGRELGTSPTVSNPTKILKGHEAEDGKYPWVVAIARRGADKRLWTYCAGSLVAKSWVLTAAHCEVLKGDYAIVSRQDLSKNTGQEILVDDVVPSIPAFDAKTANHDALLVHLAGIAEVEYIELNEDPLIEEVADTALTITGWGTTSDLGRPSNVLLEAAISTHAIAGCRSEYKHAKHKLTKTAFCASGKHTGERFDEVTGKTVADACQGDSGGGAFRLNSATGKYQLVGIISWGIGCGNDAFPGVYTRSSAVASWVSGKIHT